MQACDIQIKLLIETKSHNYILYFIQYGEVSSLVVNIMTDSVMTAPPGKSGIRFKREIWTWAGMIAHVVERRARNPEVRGSNPDSGSSFSLEIL